MVLPTPRRGDIQVVMVFAAGLVYSYVYFYLLGLLVSSEFSGQLAHAPAATQTPPPVAGANSSR